MWRENQLSAHSDMVVLEASQARYVEMLGAANFTVRYVPANQAAWVVAATGSAVRVRSLVGLHIVNCQVSCPNTATYLACLAFNPLPLSALSWSSSHPPASATIKT